MPIRNLFESIPEHLPAEATELLLAGRDVRIERIVSHGHASPEGFWYDQDQDEWVVLMAGSAGLQLDGEPDIRELRPGDFLHIPAHSRHRVAWTDADAATVWLAIFF